MTGDGGSGERILRFASITAGFGVAWEYSSSRVAVAYRTVDVQKHAAWSTPVIRQATRVLASGATMELPLADAIALDNRFAIVTGAPRVWQGGGGGGGDGPGRLPTVSPMLDPDFTPALFYSADAEGAAGGELVPLTGAANESRLSPELARRRDGLAVGWTQIHTPSDGPAMSDVWVAMTDANGSLAALSVTTLVQNPHHAPVLASRDTLASATNSVGDRCVAWLQNVNGEQHVFARIRVAGEWREIVELSHPNSKNSGAISLVALRNRCVAVWNEDGQVFTRVLQPAMDGAPVAWAGRRNLTEAVKADSEGSKLSVQMGGAAVVVGKHLYIPLHIVERNQFYVQTFQMDVDDEPTHESATDGVTDGELSQRVALPAQTVGEMKVAANAKVSAVLGRTSARMFVALYKEDKGSLLDLGDAVPVTRYWLASMGEEFVAIWEEARATTFPGDVHLWSARVHRDAVNAWVAEPAVEIPAQALRLSGAQVLVKRDYWVAVWREWDSVTSSTATRYALFNAQGWTESLPITPAEGAQTLQLAGDDDTFAVLSFGVTDGGPRWQIVKYDLAARAWSNAVRVDMAVTSIFAVTMRDHAIHLMMEENDRMEIGNETVPRLFALEGL